MLLNGPENDRSGVGAYRVAPDDAAPRSTIEWVIDRVYQRGAEELLARPGVLWPVFVPFAADASEGTVARAVHAVRERSHSREEFADAAAAIVVLAQASPRSQGLREVVMALVEPDVIENNWIFLQGIEKGITRGEAKGLREALTLTLATRGLRLTAARRAQIEAEGRPEVLQTWLTRAITAARTAEVFADPR